MTKHPKLLVQQGFTIIELMVGMVIGLIATLIIMQTFSAFEGNKRSTTGIADAQTNGSIGLYMIQRELQFAGYGIPLTSGTLPTINFNDPNGMFMRNFTNNYNYDNMTQAQVDAARTAAYNAEKARYDANLSTEAATIAAGQIYSALRCAATTEITQFSTDADNDPLTANVPVDIITPAIITDGGAGGNDRIAIQYGTTSRGALPTTISSTSGVNTISVVNNMGCRAGDAVLVMGDANKGDTSCVARTVTSVEVVDGTGQTWLDTVNNTNQIRVNSVTGVLSPLGTTRKLACLGRVRQTIFDIVGNELRKNGTPVMSEIVALQAQYGVAATANSEIVTEWRDAIGATWSNISNNINARNRVKAVRVALVARNNLLERAPVSQACNGGAAGLAQVCIWGNQAVTLPGADWANYRYRTYEIVIPLRNMLAASPQL